MSYKDIHEYNISKLASNIAETERLVLPGSNILARRVIKLIFIKDKIDSGKFIGIHVELIYQKRNSKEDSWPQKEEDLRKVPRNVSFKFSLNSAQTHELAQALQDAYTIGSLEINSGKRTVVRGIREDDYVITDENKGQLLKKLSSHLTKEDLTELLSQNLDSLSTDLALARLYRERKQKLHEFKKALEQNMNEEYWQVFFKENDWLFGSSCVGLISERRIDIHHTTDFPIKIYGGFMDIVEIKRPDLQFWKAARNGGNFKYRNKYLIPNVDVQGAIAQTTDYILQIEKKVDSLDFSDSHENILPLKPRGLIVLGRSKGWGVEEWRAFRLLNDELHTVQVITYDHLLKQGERILEVMQVTNNNSTLEEIEEIDLDDIPF